MDFSSLNKNANISIIGNIAYQRFSGLINASYNNIKNDTEIATKYPNFRNLLDEFFKIKLSIPKNNTKLNIKIVSMLILSFTATGRTTHCICYSPGHQAQIAT